MYNRDMKLNIIYSVEYNVERVNDTIDKIDWLEAKGYKPIMPEQFKGLNLKQLLVEDIKRIIAEEYDEDWYKNLETLVRKGMQENIPILKRALAVAALPTQKEYTVKLTQYGTGGSYTLPNLIILNISKELNINPIKTTLHEMIHLSIEPLIEKYEIEHWKKERLVDRMLHEIFPGFTKRMQKINTDIINRVDEVFDAYYPDIERICKELSKN